MNTNRKNRYRGRIRYYRGAVGHYHCISRIVGGQPLLRQREKEVFRRMLRKQALFCGIEILTFAIMSNHFHLLIRVVPQKLSDSELIERVHVLYGDEEAELAGRHLASETYGPTLRKRLLGRMGDVSVFLKELKQRFSIWYNKTHDRFGTLWAERFKSILVQGEDHALAAVAAYIDLNPLRAGMCKDPKDYRFCGYGEAIAGRTEARQGLNQVFGSKEWTRTQSAYRLVLFGKGYHTSAGKGRISETALKKVWNKKGELALPDLLRCRVRFFSDGLALGTAEFVEGLFVEVKDRYGWRKRKGGARPLNGGKWNGLCVLSQMRGKTIG